MTSLEAGVPAWLERDLVDVDAFHLPARLPDAAAFELRQVAERYRQSLEVPASHDTKTAILGELRLMTKTRNENPDEARARFRLLRNKLPDVPEQVLREAVDEYARNERFFPDGPAELLPYIERNRLRRSRRAYGFKMLASQAEEQVEQQRRLDNDPLTAEAAAAIIDEFGLRPETQEIIRPAGPMRKPTIEDYVQMGVDRETAERCLAERTAAA